MTNEEIRPYADKVLHYLYSQLDEENSQHLPTILDILKIDQNLSKPITDFLVHDNSPKVNFPQGTAAAYLTLTTNGRVYVSKLNPPSMSDIRTVCEFIFQELKKGSIIWTKNMTGFPKHSDEARRMMDRQSITYTVEEGKFGRNYPVTRLEPDVIEAYSYEEALKIIKEKNKPSPTVFSRIYAPDNKGTVAQSSGDESPINQSVSTTPSNADNKTKVIWYKTTLFTHIIFPVIAGLLILLIVYIIEHIHWK